MNKLKDTLDGIAALAFRITREPWPIELGQVLQRRARHCGCRDQTHDRVVWFPATTCCVTNRLSALTSFV